MRRKRIYLICFFLHFLVIVTISLRETSWLVAHKLTIFPPIFSNLAQNIESCLSGALGQNLASSNPLRRLLLTYFHMASIDRGYGYFAPNVPAAYKLVFELQYPGDRIEYELPGVNSIAGGLRLSGLLDEIGRTRDDALREYLVKMLARSIWREHPDALMIRAVFGRIYLPNINEFERGQRESYDFLYAYDFSRREKPVGSRDR